MTRAIRGLANRRKQLCLCLAPDKLTFLVVVVSASLAAMCLCADAELAPEIPEGKLLRMEQLAGSLEVGIYGPAVAVSDEPALLTTVILGNDATRISCGIVLLASPRGAMQFPQSPPVTVHYIPCRHWSAGTASEWKQLLLVGPDVRWAYNIMPLAHTAFRGGPGELLDSILTVVDPASLPVESPLRDPHKYDGTSVAFLTDESITELTGAIRGASASKTCQGAHGVRVVFPATINDPATALQVCILLEANGQQIRRTISLGLTGRTQQVPDYSEVAGPPEVSSPVDAQKVSGTVEVVGKAKPGLVVAAWIEIYDPEDPQLRTKLPPIRHITDDSGSFSIPVNLPFADAESEGNLVYELHVRSEAPAYRSIEAVRKLTPVRGS